MPQHVSTPTSRHPETDEMAQSYENEIRAIYGLFSLFLVAVLLFVVIALIII
jgi:uncharacterized membrane protein